MRGSLLLLLGLIASLLLPTKASSSTTVLDAMTDAFPPSPCLPNSGQRVIFRGGFCDGTACPPDPMVPPTIDCDQVAQSGLPGAYAPFRFASVYQDPTWTGPISARVVPGSTHLQVATSAPVDVSFLLLSYSNGTANWNLDLSTALEFHFTLEGDVSPALPLTVDLTLYDMDAPIDGENATIRLTLVAPGPVSLPLTSFTRSPSFDPSTVDEILFFFMNCGDETCPGPYPSRQFAVGPISITGDLPTASRSTTWGQLKARYR